MRTRLLLLARYSLASLGRLASPAGALLLLYACACNSSAPPEQKTVELRVFTWPDYITDNMSAMFSNEVNVDIDHDTFATNEELLAYMTASAEEPYDIIFPSDFMVSELIAQKELQKLDKKKLKNLGNIDPRFTGLPYDKENTYCVPYSWGLTGLAVNSREVTREVKGWDVLWDESLKGKLSILDEPRSGFVPALKQLGYSINTTNPEEIDKAGELMKKLRPLLKAYTSDRYVDFLRTRQVLVAEGYSGDILKLQKVAPYIKFVLPAEGTEIWVDNVCIPKDAPHKDLAHKFIDFLLRPEIAAHFTNRSNFATANKAALELIEPAVKANPAVYPPDEILTKSEFMQDIGSAADRFEALWEESKKPPAIASAPVPPSVTTAGSPPYAGPPPPP